MTRIVTIHQPNYLPWIGLFSKVMQAEYFVIADNFQFMPIVKRNLIRTQNGPQYLTIPLGRNYYQARIHDIPLPEDRSWQQSHWSSIWHHYQKTTFFQNYKYFFESLYKKEYKFLYQINMDIISYLLECFKIKVEIVMATDLHLNPVLKRTDAVIDILQTLGGSTYLSGPSGKGYLEIEKFQKNNIDLKFAKFQHPVYKQRYPGFEPNLAAIDLLFNMGPQANEIIKMSGSMEDGFSSNQELGKIINDLS